MERPSNRPTVDEVNADNAYHELASKHWLGKKNPPKRAQQKVLQELWARLEKDAFALRSLLILESLQALEDYLWPTFGEASTNDHVLLIALLINVKKREGLETWSIFADRPEDFSSLFRRILILLIDTNSSFDLRTHLLVAVIGAFQALDNGLVRKELAPLVSIGIWHNLHSERRRQNLLEASPQFKKAWKAAAKRFDGADEETRARLKFDRAWLYTLLLDFLDILHSPKRESPQAIAYSQRFLELLTDLESQFPTRRYVNTLLKDLNLLVALETSSLHAKDSLLAEFTDLLRHYVQFPFDDHTGQQLRDHEVGERHNAALAQLQRTALRQYKDKLSLLTLASYSTLDQSHELESHLNVLTDEELDELAGLVGLRTSYPPAIAFQGSRQLTVHVLLANYKRQATFRDQIRQTPILPTEEIVYDEKYARNDHYDGTRPVALPKLNLQYLTVYDFLWRSFELFRRDAFYQIRTDMEDTVKRLKPRRDHLNNVRFDGSSRLALPVSKLAIVGTTPPRVGEEYPAEVQAEAIVEAGRLNANVRAEWEALRTGDVVFLLGVFPESKTKKPADDGLARSFTRLRSAEVRQVLDDRGRPVKISQDGANGHQGRGRTLRFLLDLDARAYHADASAPHGLAMYETLNVLVRRRGRENNFKPVLHSIQALTLSNVPIPSWLQDVFLGLGDPAGATYKQLPNALKSVDYRDTFLDWQHLRDALPGKDLNAVPHNTQVSPPYVLETLDAEPDEEGGLSKRRKRGTGDAAKGTEDPDKTAGKPSKSTRSSRKRRHEELEDALPIESLRVSTYQTPYAGPYASDVARQNGVRFTPAQAEAIISGTQPGLTVILGPPGTGKTDVATQIINNIYHNFPGERTLLIAHSNQALNQLFQKIVALDIDERHLLRLGHGEGELIVESDAGFSKHGRVESLLERGGVLLHEVSRLAASISALGAHGSTCETAEYFNSVWIQPMWKKFWAGVSAPEASAEDVISQFPFHIFFSNAPGPVFSDGAPKDEVLEIARGCYRHIEKVFAELSEIRPFEVLRNNRDRANYLLVQEARVIAMTSTHAAMRRDEIASMGFRYDNVIMEEAAQITEVEAFLPLALQRPRDGELPLKRVIMCGDHLQNSPVIQNQGLRQYCNLEQSMFHRLIRLGVPSTLLDRQGRARPSIAELYRWRYPGLGDLDSVYEQEEFQLGNAGLRYEYQFVQVPDYKGKGESEPSPHFIQNLGEAEYLVALYMYMRLLGYPAARISILTTYAGQRALIRDVLNHRCAKNKLFGMPRIVTTVDQYQGEQNDYVLLSLTRTKHIGYLRDIRRLTVALSRARLGLYIFGRREVFEACPELAQAFEQLLARPDQLQLVPGELFPTPRRVEAEGSETAAMTGVEHLGQYVFEMTQAKVKSLREGAESLPATTAVAEAAAEQDDDDDVDVYEAGASGGGGDEGDDDDEEELEDAA